MTAIRILSTLLVLLGILPIVLTAQEKKKQEHPTITEFKKHGNDADPAIRKDQVEALAKVEVAEAVTLIVTRGLLDPDGLVREKAIWALAQLRSAETRAAIFEALEHSKASIREGVALALGMAKDATPSPVDKLSQHLLTDESPSVKAAAAEALGQLGNTAAGEALTKALSAPDEGIIIAAADALCLLKAPGAGPALIAHLHHPSWRVQVAALSALASIRVKEGIDPIIKYLKEAEGRPRADAHRALQKITKREFAMDAGIWQEWWDRVKGEWTVPPEIEKGPEVTVTNKNDSYGRKVPTYHKVPLFSHRVLFVIDVSTSMETQILVKQGRKIAGADPISGAAAKIKIARDELKSTLQSLNPETKFNIIAFETNIRYWQNEPVTASPSNILSAVNWLERQKARGGASLDSEGRTVGRTNTYGALRAMFGLSQKRSVGGTTGGGGPTKSSRPLWDTCFFLTDGIPTEGDITDIPTILAEVERWNKNCKMVVNTVGMEEDAGLREIIDGIARITGGHAVYVGK